MVVEPIELALCEVDIVGDHVRTQAVNAAGNRLCSSFVNSALSTLGQLWRSWRR